MTVVIRPIICHFAVIGVPRSFQARTSKETWKNLVTKAAKTSLGKPLQSDVRVELQIDWFSQVCRNKPDVDNIVKPISDALKNVIYVDDSQVSNVSVRYHDLGRVLHFVDEPIQIVKPLLSGNKEYVYIRVYRVY